MIEIKCTKAQYDRLIECVQSYYEDGKCFLGKSIRFTCPNYKDKNTAISCEECLKKHIKRVDKTQKEK